jgi:hypothetical protein
MNNWAFILAARQAHLDTESVERARETLRLCWDQGYLADLAAAEAEYAKAVAFDADLNQKTLKKMQEVSAAKLAPYRERLAKVEQDARRVYDEAVGPAKAALAAAVQEQELEHANFDEEHRKITAEWHRNAKEARKQRRLDAETRWVDEINRSVGGAGPHFENFAQFQRWVRDMQKILKLSTTGKR